MEFTEEMGVDHANLTGAEAVGATGISGPISNQSYRGGREMIQRNIWVEENILTMPGMFDVSSCSRDFLQSSQLGAGRQQPRQIQQEGDVMSKLRRILVVALPVLAITIMLFPSVFSGQPQGCGEQSGAARILNRVGLGQLLALEPPVDDCLAESGAGGVGTVCSNPGGQCRKVDGGVGNCTTVTTESGPACMCVADSHGGGKNGGKKGGKKK